MILKSKIVSSNKRIELSDILVVSIMSWLSVTSFVFSLDWKIHFNLDFVLKLFRCSKGDVWDVLLTTLQNEPTKLSQEKAGWWSYGKLTQKIWRMNWHVTAMISYICFLFLLLGMSGQHVNKHLYTLFSSKPHTLLASANPPMTHFELQSDLVSQVRDMRPWNFWKYVSLTKKVYWWNHSHFWEHT